MKWISFLKITLGFLDNIENIEIKDKDDFEQKHCNLNW